jgi:L-threonylcarbamoyladenylate synthase
MNKDIEEALKVLAMGGIILYPTDTVWGIGCDATKKEAVQRIYRIKKTEEKEGMLVLVDSPEMLNRFAEIPEIAGELIDAANRPLTIIYPGARNLATNLIATDNSVGIRIVADPFCSKLIRKLKMPVVSTSANISGEPNPAVYSEISKQIIDNVDYVVKWRQDDNTKTKPSGIIKLGINGEVKIIRE